MNNKYFILKPAVDTPETGNAYPAAESYDNYDFMAPNSVHKLNFREFPDFEPDIRFKLAKGAKLTDMLSQAAISAHGFLINKKLKDTFEQFKIVPHKYYPATIEDNQGNFHQYFWMHLVWKEAKDFIKWEDSKFYKKRLSKNLGDVSIKKEEDILSEREKCDVATLIDFTTISFKNHDFDMFLINYFTEIYVSKKAAETLTKNKLTGIETISADKLLLN